MAFLLCLKDGDGVEKDPVEGARYLKLAADNGNPLAQMHYGLCLKKGESVPVNLEQAVWYLKVSADQGEKDAQYGYAQCLRKGEGVAQDRNAALQYYKMAKGDAKTVTESALSRIETLTRAFLEWNIIWHMGLKRSCCTWKCDSYC